VGCRRLQANAQVGALLAAQCPGSLCRPYGGGASRGRDGGRRVAVGVRGVVAVRGAARPSGGSRRLAMLISGAWPKASVRELAQAGVEPRCAFQKMLMISDACPRWRRGVSRCGRCFMLRSGAVGRGLAERGPPGAGRLACAGPVPGARSSVTETWSCRALRPATSLELVRTWCERLKRELALAIGRT
jgi:hypothetical protein